MRLLINTFIAISLLGLSLIIGGLLLVQYSPQALLSLSPYVSPYYINTEKMSIDLSTPSIVIAGLRVNNANETAVTLENFTFSTSWQSLITKSQAWNGFAENGVVHLNQLVQRGNSASAETSAPNISALHNMLKKANIAVANIIVNITDTSSAKLNFLRRPDVLQAAEQGLEFSIVYQHDAVTFPLQGTLLSTVSNSASGSVPQITLNLPTLDLRNILSAQAPKQDPQNASTDTEASTVNTKRESRIHWSPLSQLTPLNLVFQSEKIRLSQGSMTNVRSHITLTNVDDIQGIQHEHTANVALTLNNDIAINQSVVLRGNWKVLAETTSGADIEGNTVLSLGNNNSVGNSIGITGKVNLNGILGQDIALTTTINQFPGNALSTQAAQQKKALERLLPLKANAKLNLQKGQLSLTDMAISAKDSDLNGNFIFGFDKAISDLRTITFDINSKALVIPNFTKNTRTPNTQNTSEKATHHIPVDWLNKIKADGKVSIGELTYNDEMIITSARSRLTLQQNKLSLNDIAVIAKESDINGHIAVDLNEKTTHLYAITFDLNSDQLVIPDTEAIDNKASSPQPTSTTNMLFTNDVLPTDWLNTIKAEGNISIATVMHNNQTLMTHTDSRITLDKDMLHLHSQIGSIAGGQSTIDLSIDNTDNKMAIAINASAKGIILESLALVPKRELSGGKMRLDLALTSYGVSTKALASHLQGDLLLVVTDGIIANNTFELIGSDMLLTLLNAINPFYKRSKTTQLECAVVKSIITDGKMLFDHSIAIKTSEMIIIADGEVDLTTEQINLGINPKARKGVGIDVASLAKFVAIRGSLTQPKVGVSGTGTARSILNIGAAISTGGLSLLVSKLADTVISRDACDVAKNAFTQKKSSKRYHYTPPDPIH